MEPSISLTEGLRNSLLSLAQTSSRMESTQLRLSSGKKVNSPLDSPANYFAALGNRQKAADLSSLKDGIWEANQVIKAADAGMEAIMRVLSQASAIAEGAITASSAGQLTLYLDQFNEMLDQIDQLTLDSSYRQVNLLRREDLEIDLGNGNYLTVEGDDATANGFDNMTDGLKMEAAALDPLNISQLHTVRNASGDIKEDGALTVTNGDYTSIDDWLGSSALKVQTITSQDLAVATDTPLSDGRMVLSQILDNVGVASYGSSSFTLSREIEARVTALSDPLLSATASVNDLQAVSGFLGATAGGGVPVTLTKSPTLSSAATTSASGALILASISDAAVVSQFLDAAAANADLSLSFNAATQLWSSANPSLSLIQGGGSPPSSLGLVLDGSGVPALALTLGGSWNNNDQIQLSFERWTSSDPEITVNSVSGNTLSLSVAPAGGNDVALSFSVAESAVAYGTSIDLSLGTGNWTSSDASVTVSEPIAGVVTADLNGDGTDDLEFQLPTDGPGGAAWLSTETITATTTGAFGSSDPTVRLRYDAGSGNLGLYLGGGAAPGLSINLSGDWAANGLASSPLGNDDTIELTVDGRHRWVLSDNETPNTGGLRLSMEEAKDAIETLRRNVAKNASLSSVLTVRSDFVDSMVGILETGADGLVLADTDEEGANMLMLQIRGSLATQSLGMFGSSSSTVLKLFA